MTDEQPLVIEPDMASAGAELFSFSFEAEKLGLSAEKVARIQQIAAWASLDRPSDYERALVKVAGGVVGVMKRAGFPFDDDKPIVAQFETFVSQLAK